MSDYPSMVVLKGKVYIGGGFAEDDIDGRKVIVYDPLKDFCSTLPPYVYDSFSMAVVNNQLVLVGGCKPAAIHDPTDKLGVWNEQLRRWTYPLPRMITACYRPTVLTHKDRWLVVIGGEGAKYKRLSREEILDAFSNQWCHSIPLPQTLGCAYTLAATIGSVCYLLGGYMEVDSTSTRVVSVCLDDLVSQLQTVSQPASGSSPKSSPWQTLPNTPLRFSTPLAVNGTLL